MTDNTTTLDELKEAVRRFVDEREWSRFHSPKNLAMSAAIEAAELMEHFQWISMEESRNVTQNREKTAEIGEEVADVLCYLLALANQLQLDLSDTIERKMRKNALKYPVEEYKGRYGPEDPGGAS